MVEDDAAMAPESGSLPRDGQPDPFVPMIHDMLPRCRSQTATIDGLRVAAEARKRAMRIQARGPDRALGGLDIGQRKVIALVEQWDPGVARAGISEAVVEIERGRVP